MSNCERLRTDLVAFDRGELDGAEEAAVREHVAACAACARELARVRRTFELVARATSVEPTPAGSARLRGVVEDALIAAAAEKEPVHRLLLRRRLRESWDDLRARYERSASFRRFTVASIGVHAAAAILLAVLLARAPGTTERPVTFRFAPPETEFTLPDGRSEDERTASLLPGFDAATPAGVAVSGAPGAVFPNAATAARWGATASAATRREALRVAFADGAQGAEFTIDRGLAWLAAQRGADGTWPEEGTDRPSAETTAAAVLAFAGGGRSVVEDAGLAQSVAWLERNADVVERFEDRALALRALTAQLVTDYRHLAEGDRARRSRTVATIAARLEADVLANDQVAGDTQRALATAAALADARVAGFHDGSRGLSALVRRIEWRRTQDGRLTGATGAEGVLMTADLAEIAADAGARPFADTALSSLHTRLTAASEVSTREAAHAASALAALGRSVREPVAAVVRSQRADGSWQDGAAGRSRPDTAATAYGVVAVTRAFRR